MKEVKFTFGIELILFIIFLMLKLDGIIDWQWIWIFSPFWITWIVQAIVSVATIIWVAIANAIVEYKSNQRRFVASGPRLVWDPKTNTMYGPWSSEEE